MYNSDEFSRLCQYVHDKIGSIEGKIIPVDMAKSILDSCVATICNADYATTFNKKKSEEMDAKYNNAADNISNGIKYIESSKADKTAKTKAVSALLECKSYINEAWRIYNRHSTL